MCGSSHDPPNRLPPNPPRRAIVRLVSAGDIDLDFSAVFGAGMTEDETNATAEEPFMTVVSGDEIWVYDEDGSATRKMEMAQAEYAMKVMAYDGPVRVYDERHGERRQPYLIGTDAQMIADLEAYYRASVSKPKRPWWRRIFGR